MPLNPQNTYDTTLIDFSEEKANFAIYIPAYNVVTNPNVLSTLIPDFWNAVNALTLMNRVASGVNWYQEKYSTVLPTDPSAQRENKWLVRYQDNVNFALYRFEIPGADLSLGLLPGTDILDPTLAAYTDFRDAFQALGRSPEGNNVTLLDITFVGRST